MSSLLDLPFSRADGRAPDALRPVSFVPGIAPYATGSVLCRFGQTQVICAVTAEPKVPAWMQSQRKPGGWLTAEYTMLPYSTLDRKARAGDKSKPDGRAIEIQRLLGRALRAVVNLERMPQMTFWIDCDVLQADGGTRTAAITGSWVALRLAVLRLLRHGQLKEDPLTGQVAAISAGLVAGQPLLDLAYVEDVDAEVDANIVMTATGHLVEVQASGEEAVYTRPQLDQMLTLAEGGCRRLFALQQAAIAAAPIT